MAAIERTNTSLLFKTRSPVEPLEIEYYRGFRQGVMYVLDGLPGAVTQELERKLKELDKESDN